MNRSSIALRMLAALGAVVLPLACTPPAQEMPEAEEPTEVAETAPAVDEIDEMGNPLTCNWGYGPEDGPAHWAELCSPTCAGERQSPIDIVRGQIETAVLPALEPVYAESHFELFNNGHTIEAELEEPANSLSIGDKTYELVQLHFHSGSEHTADGEQLPIEMHLVHSAGPDDLAVVGVVIGDGAPNPAFEPIWSDLPPTKETPRRPVDFDPRALLPAKLDYLTYPGSLTTPNCNEIVTWYVLEEGVEMSPAQIEAFRAIFDHNFRPPQPLNGRVVRASR